MLAKGSGEELKKKNTKKWRREFLWRLWREWVEKRWLRVALTATAADEAGVFWWGYRMASIVGGFCPILAFLGISPKGGAG